MEHRGLIGAIGIALVSIGLSSLFAYSTAAFALKRTFDWFSSFALAGEIVAAVGIVTLLLAARLIVTQRQRLQRINEFTGIGNSLMDRLEVSGPKGGFVEDEMIRINVEVVNWANEVDVWLARNLSLYAHHFRNRGGMVTLPWQTMPSPGLLPDGAAAFTVCLDVLSAYLSRLADLTLKM